MHLILLSVVLAVYISSMQSQRIDVDLVFSFLFCPYIYIYIYTCFRLALPEDPPWWYLFDVTEQQLIIVATEIQKLYSMSKVRVIEFCFLVYRV